MLLNVDDITCGYGGGDVLRDVSLHVDAGEFVGILGANGSGKSTLLRAMSRILRPRRGCVRLEGRDLYDTVSITESARSIAVLSQESAVTFDFSAHEIVLMGRHPHLRRFEPESDFDLKTVRGAMERTGTWEFRNRSVLELSGGERQRVMLARALAQEPRVLLLDEPTTHLDLGHQLQVMKIVRDLGCAVVAALHDLNIAAAYCRRVVVLEGGGKVADGTPHEVLTGESVQRIYGVHASVEERSGRPAIFPEYA